MNFRIGTTGYGYISKIHSIAYNCMKYCYQNFEYNVILDKLLTSKEISTSETGYNQHLKKIKEIRDVDILDICSPNFVHKNQIENSIKQGVKNIYCEKPIAGIYEDEVYLTQLVEDNDVCNQTALIYRFLPTVNRAKKIIQEGIIGDVIHFKCCFYHESYLNKNRPMSWRLEKSKSGGGAFIDLGVHMIDLISYVLGEIQAIEGITKTVIDNRISGNENKKVDVDDFVHMDITMKNDVNGFMEVSRVSSGFKEGVLFEIYGTKGSIKITTLNPLYPEVYSFAEQSYKIGNFISFDDVEYDINKIWPTGKYSLGWMVDAHMASLYSFLLNIDNKKLKFMKLPTFRDSMNAIKLIEEGYK